MPQRCLNVSVAHPRSVEQVPSEAGYPAGAPQKLITFQGIESVSAPWSIAGSPEFKELIGTQSGNKFTGQLCHGTHLPVQFQPAVDTPKVAHPLHAE